MDREHLGSLLFLSSMAASAAACAGGSSGPAPNPGPFVTNGGDEGGESSDTWTDPLETSGGLETSDSMGSGDAGDWPGEGETGSLSGGTTGGADLPPGGTAAPGTGSSSDTPTGSTGDYGSASTGYGPIGDDPCPALAQLYAGCDSDYTYESEIELCDQATAQAHTLSPGCGAAHSDYLACLSTLDCATLLQPGVPLPCVIQGAATDLACMP